MEAVNDPQAAYRAHGPALVREAERILRSRDDATDIVHALFVDHAAALPIGRVRLDDHIVGVRLIAALADRLDERHLEVLVARFVDDMTQEEIAVHLGVSRKTVGKRLDRIRAETVALREVA